jgi:hypothetical protein
MAEAAGYRLSDDGAAILLLTTWLGGSAARGHPAPLADTDWSSLAERIRQSALGRPSELLRTSPSALTVVLGLSDSEADRVSRLLSRGAQLAIQLDRWQRQGVWAVTRADPAYPVSVKRVLGRAAPPALFGVGNPELLDLPGPGLIVSGRASRGDRFAEAIAVSTARASLILKTTASTRPEDTAVNAALQTEGRVVVIGQPPQRVLRIGLWREAAIAGFLCVISSREPGARPLPEAQRNRLLSAIAGVLVVAQAAGPGEVARAVAGVKPGKRAYVRVGGRLGPRSIPRGFEPIPVDSEAPNPTLEGWLMHVSARVLDVAPTVRIQIRPLLLYRLFIDALSTVGHPVTAEEAADALGLVPKQAEAWLQKAVDDGLAHEADGRYLVRSAQEELPL